MTKEPLSDPATFIAVVVTGPVKADEIGFRAGLKAIGFEVTERVMEIDSDIIDINDMESSDGATGPQVIILVGIYLFYFSCRPKKVAFQTSYLI